MTMWQWFAMLVVLAVVGVVYAIRAYRIRAAARLMVRKQVRDAVKEAQREAEDYGRSWR